MFNDFITYSLDGNFPKADSKRLTRKLGITLTQDVQLALYNSAGLILGYYHNYFIRKPRRFFIVGNYILPRDINIENHEILIRDSVQIFIKSGADKGTVLYKTSDMNKFSIYTGRCIHIKNNTVIDAKLIDEQGKSVGNQEMISIKKNDNKK